MPDDDTPATFAERLREARRWRGMTQQELADASRVPIPPLSRMENGRQTPRPATVERLAAALGVEPAWLLFGTGPLRVRRARRSGAREGLKGQAAKPTDKDGQTDADREGG